MPKMRGGPVVRVLNLYAGLGGNRKLWPDNIEVTAVEINPEIAAVYRRQFPLDSIAVGHDAHKYLLDFYERFDFIWTSPPCQSHTRMRKFTRHHIRAYPDLSLYQEILFLKNFFKGKWVVENVVPYYDPLIPGKRMGRHMFWSNFDFPHCEVPSPPDFINKCTVAGKRAMQEWLGIHYEENIYYEGNHCPAQILRNCVHPVVGRHIFDHAFLPEP